MPDGFRLHYFPNIPIDEPAQPCFSRNGNSDFQRSLFKNMDLEPACADVDADAPIAESPVEDKGPSVDDIKEAAFQKGFLEGKRVGFETGAKKADSVADCLRQVLGELENIRQEIYQEIEKEVAQLALSIARKIVCHEVKTAPETVIFSGRCLKTWIWSRPVQISMRTRRQRKARSKIKGLLLMI